MSEETSKNPDDYVLDAQVGFLLRKASQRHTSIFSDIMMRDLTPTRFAALAKLYQLGPLSQNVLGRHTAMDIATIKGVVDRLRDRDMVSTRPDPTDGRRQLIQLTAKGEETVKVAISIAYQITDQTLAPLTPVEKTELQKLLLKIS